MEEKINNQKIKTYSRAILNYCLRVLIFLGLCREMIITKSVYILSPIFDAIFKFSIEETFDIFIQIAVYSIFAFILSYYFLAKITGIFKKLDKLNFFLSLAIIFIISIILNYSEMVQIQLNPFKIGFEQKTIIHILPFVFLLYKLLESLTKTFPVPFKKIGYVCSIEFFRDLAKKIKNYSSKELSK